MAWEKEGSDTLGSAAVTVTVPIDTPKIFLVALTHLFADSGTMQELLRYNSSSGGTDYAFRRNENGGGETTAVSQSFIGGFHPANPDGFVINYIVDISGEEVLSLGWGVGNNAAGASNAPSRREVVGKFVSGQITSVDFDVSVASNFDTDSDLSVLGTN